MERESNLTSPRAPAVGLLCCFQIWSRIAARRSWKVADDLRYHAVCSTAISSEEARCVPIKVNQAVGRQQEWSGRSMAKSDHCRCVSRPK